MTNILESIDCVCVGLLLAFCVSFAHVYMLLVGFICIVCYVVDGLSTFKEFTLFNMHLSILLPCNSSLLMKSIVNLAPFDILSRGYRFPCATISSMNWLQRKGPTSVILLIS